ncbi:MAG: cobyrinate a,c-diamide synthase [Desulfobacterales bacterium]|nr:cobyrinate a,c-diamide synthase [Desulfobacterales bacterium]
MQDKLKSFPGLVIAGLRGGSGKTIVSLGLTSAWTTKKYKVSCFKKGPDYIDAGWLSYAAGTPCYNLDTYLCSENQVTNSFNKHFKDSDIAVVEGNRGLFDAIDTDGKTCTAELAKLLGLPVLLVVDCTKATRTVAALVMGCMTFDPELNIMGVILNRVAGKRHEGKLRKNIEKFCNIPVLGSIPKLRGDQFPERHMGLVTFEEHEGSKECIDLFSKVANENIDLDAIYTICNQISKKTIKKQLTTTQLPTTRDLKIQLGTAQCPTIGIIKDSAFQFYYPDNIEALIARGAKIKYISPLNQQNIPSDLDAIYMGGGFPETHAAKLAANINFKSALKKLAEKGLPIYAECGGFIFLGQSIEIDKKVYPMSGILPVKFGLSERPEGHGYTSVKVVSKNSYYERDQIIRGHEFRYSTILDIDFKPHEMAFKMERGKGIIDKLDGFSRKNVFATYTHIHTLTTPLWAEGIIKQAIQYKASK